jgi:hypothetical protein
LRYFSSMFVIKYAISHEFLLISLAISHKVE